MPVSLDPIDKDETAYRVLLDGKRIGIVKANTTLGERIWQYQARDQDPFTGVFSEAQHAAEQLAVNKITKRKRKR